MWEGNKTTWVLRFAQLLHNPVHPVVYRLGNKTCGFAVIYCGYHIDAENGINGIHLWIWEVHVFSLWKTSYKPTWILLPLHWIEWRPMEYIIISAIITLLLSTYMLCYEYKLPVCMCVRVMLCVHARLSLQHCNQYLKCYGYIICPATLLKITWCIWKIPSAYLSIGCCERIYQNGETTATGFLTNMVDLNPSTIK